MFALMFSQWGALFYSICFFGWCLESLIVSIQKRRFVNRGFLRGPVLPIYGIGMLAILLTAAVIRLFTSNPFCIYIGGILVCTVLEYAAGVFLERVFQKKYWDYSGEIGQFQSRICLKASLFWGFLTMLVVYVLYMPFVSAICACPIIWIRMADAAFTVVFAADVVASAIDARRHVVNITSRDERTERWITAWIMQEMKAAGDAG
ncbi:MAG: putative ABC transporter permease [Clostridia bacterium]|nr:putative ABC transporter permease [Clostridia bacterium]